MHVQFFRLLLVLWTITIWCCSPDKPKADCAEIDAINRKASSFLPSLPDSALILASEAVRLNDSQDCKGAFAESHKIMGIVFYHYGLYQESLSHLLLSGQTYDDVNDSLGIADNFNQLGIVYYNIKQPGLALEHHEKARVLYEKMNNSAGVAYTFGCIGRLYEKRKEYTKALDFQQQALQYYRQTNDTLGSSSILENIGSIYEDLSRYPEALGYFKRSLEISLITGDSLSIIVNYNNIGDNYRKTGDYSTAVVWTKKAVELAARLKDKYQLSSGYKDLSKIYSLAGDYEKAYMNLEIGRNLYQDMYTSDATRQLALFHTLFEIERKNHDLEVLESSERFNQTIKIALTSFLALIIMLGTVIISRQRLKIKKNRETLEQERQIHETRSRLWEVEKENSELNELNLQNELETKAKSLTAHTLSIIGKNKILENIQNKLSQMLKEGLSDHRKEIKNVVKMIEHNFVQDKDWIDFTQIFEQVHEDFFQKIQLRSPEATPSELRLAALIRLNIPAKDIATILGISTDSLRIARYRLRKKLQLETGQSLSHFILSL